MLWENNQVSEPKNLLSLLVCKCNFDYFLPFEIFGSRQIFEGSIDFDACSKLKAFLSTCCKIHRNLRFFGLVLLSPPYFSTVDSRRLWTMTETLQDARPPRQLHATCRGNIPLISLYLTEINLQNSCRLCSDNKRIYSHSIFVHELLKFYSIYAVVSDIHTSSDSHSNKM